MVLRYLPGLEEGSNSFTKLQLINMIASFEFSLMKSRGHPGSIALGDIRAHSQARIHSRAKRTLFYREPVNTLKSAVGCGGDKVMFDWNPAVPLIS
jgi:hypothetical protein